MQTVAILGATGSGKSTLIHLIPRFYDVTGGRILLDGIDVRDLPLDVLRSQVGIAMQEAVLFSGTIRDNIRYGRPNASDEAVDLVLAVGCDSGGAEDGVIRQVGRGALHQGDGDQCGPEAATSECSWEHNPPPCLLNYST